MDARPSLAIAKGSDHDDIDIKRLPYILRQNLGNGACCLVEEVQDRNTGLILAHKVFALRRRNRLSVTATFQNEVRVLRKLEQHRHMVCLHATYTSKGQLGMLLSPVADSGDLDGFLGELKDQIQLKGQSNANVQSMISIIERAFGCLAEGLSFMQRKRIRHKDIKLSNILIHQGRVLYTDFGISLDSSQCDNSTTEGPTEMTRRYAAPEVLYGKEKNSSSDIFSLGCVYIEMLSTLTHEIQVSEHDLFSDLMPGIRHQLESTRIPSQWSFVAEIILSMTAYDPKARSTALQVLDKVTIHPGFACESCHSPDSISSRPLVIIEPVEMQSDVRLPFSLIRNLGHGDSGIVTEVRENRTGAVFARKTIQVTKRYFDRARAQDTFENEVKIIRGLSKHSHVVKLVATYKSDKHFGIVMLPVAEYDLEQYLDTYQDLQQAPNSTMLDSMTATLRKAYGCLASGLAFMHNKRVRHKDIRPSNILVHNGTVLFTDFGYSADFSSEAYGSPRVQRSQAQRYAAPEVLGLDPRGSYSDVYSLGCVYLEMLTILANLDPIPVDTIFSRNMDNRLDQIGSAITKRAPEYQFMYPILVSMLQRVPSKRASASMVASLLMPQHSFCCAQCRNGMNDEHNTHLKLDQRPSDNLQTLGQLLQAEVPELTASS